MIEKNPCPHGVSNTTVLFPVAPLPFNPDWRRAGYFLSEHTDPFLHDLHRCGNIVELLNRREKLREEEVDLR